MSDLNIYEKLKKAKAKTKAKEHLVLVCRFHPNKMMVAHQTKERDGTTKSGLHCPKCFFQNSGIPVPIQLPSSKYKNAGK